MSFVKQAYHQVIQFWFQEIDSAMWFVKDGAFDAEIKDRFENMYIKASRGEYYGWRESIYGRLAEIILLDQFPRNMYRNQAQAFATDSVALILSQEAINGQNFHELGKEYQRFMLMPWMHSESILIHQKAEKLFEFYDLKKALKYERQHKKIIERFNRYPHRNEVLGRQSTPEELEFLEQFEGF